MGGKGGGSGLGGAKIDTDSVRMTYLRTSNVDPTPRIKPFVQTTGIEIPDVELPAGGEEAMRAEILARCWRPRRVLISLLNDDPAGPGAILIILLMRTLQEILDCTIHQHRMGLHRAVARVLDPNHGCIRRIVVEVIQ